MPRNRQNTGGSSIKTSLSLIERMKDLNDDEAWNQFYNLYSPLVIGFCRKQGCTESLAADVLQETMCQLMKYLPKFSYDQVKGKFRTYLIRIAISRIGSLYARQLQTLPIEKLPDEALSEIIETSDASWQMADDSMRREVLNAVLKIVCKRIDDMTWRSFQMYVLEQQNADIVANKLNITRNLVYQHRNRVVGFLKNEVKKLMDNVTGLDEKLDEIDNDTQCKTSVNCGDHSNSDNGLLSREIDNRIRYLTDLLRRYPPTEYSDACVLVIETNENREQKAKWQTIASPFTIGSGSQNKLYLKYDFISREHCQITSDCDGWHLNDCESKNGVFINGIKIVNKKLANGDIIQISDIVLIFFNGGEYNSISAP